MIMRFLISSFFSKILFRIFKPINPIDFDGVETFENNFFRKTVYFIKEINLTKIKSGESFFKALIILKEAFITFFKTVLYPISYLISLTNFRFLHINSWQIGAYVQQLDTIIKANKLDHNYKLVLVYPKFLKANNFLDKFYINEIIIIENIILYLIAYPFMHTKICSINNWKYETINPKSAFNQIHKIFREKYKKDFISDINLDTKMIVKKYLKNKNILLNKKIVCLQFRNQNFYKGPKTRNTSINIINPIIDHLIKKDFFVVQFVSEYSTDISSEKRKYYLELKNNDEISKKVQFSFINESSLVICYQGGIHSMNQIVKTPFLQINSIPININGLIKSNDKIIFKKFYSNVDKKYLSFKEMIKKKLHLYVDVRSVLKNKVEIVDNSLDEIINSIDEMISFEKIENSLSQNLIKNLCKEISFHYSDARISETFLKENTHFLAK